MYCTQGTLQEASITCPLRTVDTCSWFHIYSYTIEMYGSAQHEYIHLLATTYSLMLAHAAVHKSSHMHKTLRETTQPPYRDPFHLSLLTTVVSCGLIGPHQTTSHITCIPFLLPRTLLHTPTHSFPLSFHTSCSTPPTPFSCLPFISFHLSSLLNSTTGITVIL